MLLEKYNISQTVNLILEANRIIIEPVEQARQGWEKAFKQMAENKDDNILLDDVFVDENFEEWK